MIKADERPKSLAERFEQFHDDNPRVYAILVRLAREWVQATGRRTLGIKALWERARWEMAITTRGDEFKLNNNYHAFYARKIMAQEPDLAGIFKLRRSAADAAVVPIQRVMVP